MFSVTLSVAWLSVSTVYVLQSVVLSSPADTCQVVSPTPLHTSENLVQHHGCMLWIMHVEMTLTGVPASLLIAHLMRMLQGRAVVVIPQRVPCAINSVSAEHILGAATSNSCTAVYRE